MRRRLVTFDGGRTPSGACPRQEPGSGPGWSGDLLDTPDGRGTAAEPAMRQVTSLLVRRGLVVLVSDLLFDRNQALTALRFLRHCGHQVIVVHLMDRAEIELTGPPEVRYRDPESAASVVVRPRELARAYAATVEREITAWRSACRRHGIAYHHVLRRAVRHGAAPARVTFLNPLVLLGLAAAAIPALLHLFERRTPPEAEFPPLRYLSEAERRSARRLKLQHVLLLLLRTALIALVVLAAARPVVPIRASGAHEPTALVVILDNSPSSG